MPTPTPYNDPEVTAHVRGLMQTIPPTYSRLGGFGPDLDFDLSPVTHAFTEAAEQMRDFAENAHAAVHAFNARQLLIDNELAADQDGTYPPPPPPGTT